MPVPAPKPKPRELQEQRKAEKLKKPLTRDDEIEAGLRLVFGDASDSIQELMESNDTDSAIVLAQKKMLASTLALIPNTEKLVDGTDGTKGVYQYSTLINTARSLIEDISAQQDAQLIAESINTNYVHPTVLSLLQFTVDSLYRLRAGLKDYIQPEDKKAVGAMINDTANGMAAFYESKSVELQGKIMKRITD